MSESQKPKVSVIVVCHSKYIPMLRIALDSLNNQTPHELIIIANGCNIDHPKAVSVPRQSLARASNHGISLASGDYIVRMDADDWADSELLRVESEYLDANPGVDCVWCDYVEAKSKTKTDEFELFFLEHAPQYELEHACGAMFRKQVWESLGGYDEQLEYQEAFDFWSRFNRAGYRAERVEIPMYLYRRGHDSMSTNPERDKVRKALEEKYK